MISYTDFRKKVIDGVATCRDEVEKRLSLIVNNKENNHFITTNDDDVRCSAIVSDERFSSGEPRLLEGMIIGIKDNISVLGLPTTCGSKMLANYVPVFDATVIKRLKDAGAIIIGKTNMDEFAMGSSNETSFFGAIKNPHNNDYVPGGSSGGSAACVITEEAHTALGTDTGGSIRQPAALCGTFGFKPTYGRISRYGAVALSSSLDQIGTLTNNIEDIAAILDTVSGYDKMDSTTANLPPTDSLKNINQPLPKTFNIGIVPNSILKYCSDDVLNIYHSYLDKLRTLGGNIMELDFDFVDICVPTYIIIATSEASSNLSRLDSVRYGYRTAAQDDENNFIKQSRGEAFGIEVKRRLLMGTYFLSNEDELHYISKAKSVRSHIKKIVDTSFDNVDIIFSPTTTTTAFRFNERADDPISMYMSDFFTISANLAGNPAISVPAGVGSNGMPIGMHFQSGNFQDEKLLNFTNIITKT